jgi:inosine-uridine nucleoside N-ribohydrolase
MTRQSVLIDCDPGHDDAIAILYAARKLDLVAITTTFGNAPLEATTRNALAVCRLGGLDVPVSAGADRPLVAPPPGRTLHGSGGLDGAEMPAPDRDVTGRHAALTIIEEARARQGRLLLVAVGPLTNVALALRLEPRLPEWLAGLSVMGGSTGIGNVTRTAEFNIHCDPEAAAIVFGCGIPVWMAGLNVTRQALVTPAEVARLRGSGGKVGQVMGDLLDLYGARSRETYGLAGAPMHDLCALLPFTAPGLITHQDAHVHLELASPELRGTTAADLRRVIGEAPPSMRPPLPPNAKVAVAIDGPGAVREMLDTILAYDTQGMGGTAHG